MSLKYFIFIQVDNTDKEVFYSSLNQYIEEDGDIDDIVDDVLMITSKDEQSENSDDDGLIMVD